MTCPRGPCSAPTTCPIWFWWALHLRPRRYARRGNTTDQLYYSELTSSAPKRPPPGEKRLLSQNFLQNSNVSIKQSHPVSSPRLLTHSLWSTPAWTGHQRASVWFCSDSTERRTAGDSSPVKTGVISSYNSTYQLRAVAEGPYLDQEEINDNKIAMQILHWYHHIWCHQSACMDNWESVMGLVT